MRLLLSHKRGREKKIEFKKEEEEWRIGKDEKR
jgi:hypothetical protein